MSVAELSNAAIADALEELGDLYELDGAIVHRVLAYRSAAKAVREASLSVAALAREGRATELPGIGKTLQEKILTLLQTGTIPSAERLRARFPPGLIAITRLRPVRGLGPKLEASVLSALDEMDAHPAGGAPRVLLPRAIEIGEALVAGLTELGGPGRQAPLRGAG